MSEWEDLFGPHGPLAANIPGFSTRSEQIGMATHVARALRTRSRLVVEAGTGTGKTFAYLVPALLSGRRVVISTGTRTLQDQLYARDLPTVAAAVGRPVRVALLKGRSNYLCLHRLELAEQQAAARGLRREVATSLRPVRDWARITRRGDVAELSSLPESAPVWPWVTSTRDNCLGPECASFDRCHVVQARRDAQAADVIVVNHHLLMADLMLKEDGFGDLLPQADAVIIDEAHQLADVASLFLGFTISARQLQSLARDIAAEAIAGAPQIENSAAQTLERQVVDIHDAFSSMRDRWEFHEWPPAVIDTIVNVQESVRAVAEALEDAAENHAGLATIRRRALELDGRLGSLLEPEADVPASVRWAQRNGDNVAIHYRPVDVAAQLSDLIGSHTGAWICASATLAIGEDFNHFTNRVGMTDAVTVRFGSPFDYASQALLYLPRGIDAPSSPRHTQQVVEAALPVLAASGGRAFLLFTSHRALREAADILLRRLGPTPPYPILVQGDAPRDTLLTRFRDYGNAVLLGTSSFWEGVDVKGPALSVVVIDKLPFTMPDDPVLKARLAAIERRGGNAFFEEQVPQAVITLKQGVGRLIRDPDDFGVVMLCDQRVRTKGYGRIFLDSLPAMKRTDNLSTVTEFLRDKLLDADIEVPAAAAAERSDWPDAWQDTP